ncbi:MAG TPA: ZIP family metal transporter [Fimbriimonadaceae bacterium]|nr:ZIP family metal transporter [Fimbriimonadaceae bacterium]
MALAVNLASLLRARLELLVHVATGALLGITAFDILPEAKAALSWPVFIASAAFGYILLWVVGRFVFLVCPSCAIAHLDESSVLVRKGSLILLGAALGTHCLLDGMAIATGGALSARAEMGALAGVALHKLPEGLALGLVLVSARYSRRRTLGIASAIEAITVLGALAGLIIARVPGHFAVGLVFAIVGGGFVYLVLNALGGALSHPAQMPRGRSLATELVSFVATGVLFWLAGRA